MRVVDYIQTLNTTPRHQEEEYQYTSDFLEWFYTNVYLLRGGQEYPQIYSVVKDPGYDKMKELCKNLINVQSASKLDNTKIHTMHSELKDWTISTFLKYNYV